MGYTKFNGWTLPHDDYDTVIDFYVKMFKYRYSGYDSIYIIEFKTTVTEISWNSRPFPDEESSEVIYIDTLLREKKLERIVMKDIDLIKRKIS